MSNNREPTNNPFTPTEVVTVTDLTRFTLLVDGDNNEKNLKYQSPDATIHVDNVKVGVVITGTGTQ